MAGFNSENLVDLAKTTLNSLGEPNYTNLMSDLQEYVAFTRLYDKAKQQEESGKGIQWDVALNPSNNAANVGLYEEDSLNVMDGMTQASVDWRNTRGGYAISKQEISMNTGKRQIVDLLKFKRAQGMVNLADLMEANFWKFPAASDTKTPLGLPYWVTKTNSSTPGFNAALPTGYSSVAGLVPASQPRWNPWSGLYTDVSKDDLVRKMREAAVKTHFKSPVATPTNNTGYKYTINTNYEVVQTMEELLEAQNDSLGNDVASKDGMVMFRKIPVEYVPYLDADTTNPVYGINWGEFKVKVLKGWWMREDVIDKTPGQHTVISVFFDCTYQIITYNRRSHFVFATAATYPS